jgi:hypothetical protein
MAGNRFGSGSSNVTSSSRETSSTLAFGATKLGVEGPSGAYPQTPARVLEILREKLSRCRVMVNDSGIACEMNIDKTMLVYRNLSKNLRGAGLISIGDLKFMVGRTRSTWFLLYDNPPEELYEDSRFMSVDFKNRDVLVLENGKSMFLSRVSRHDIDLMNGIAAVSSGRKAKAPDTLAPDPEGGVSYSDLSRKLKAARDVYSEDLLFSMDEFADGIKFVTTLQDENGNTHYYIVSGEEEHAFWLYINTDPGAPEKSLFMTTFTYNNDSCIMYQED